ncbi:MAG: hypothetical protein AAGE80_17695 [Pseudomonadota bacterium]
MTEQNRRVDVRLGTLAISVQGFDDPVAPIQRIFQSVQQLLRAEPGASNVAIGLDDAIVQDLLRQLADDPDMPEESVEAVPGLVIVRKAPAPETEDTVEEPVAADQSPAAMPWMAGAQEPVEAEEALPEEPLEDQPEPGFDPEPEVEPEPLAAELDPEPLSGDPELEPLAADPEHAFDPDPALPAADPEPLAADPEPAFEPEPEPLALDPEPEFVPETDAPAEPASPLRDAASLKLGEPEVAEFIPDTAPETSETPQAEDQPREAPRIFGRYAVPTPGSDTTEPDTDAAEAPLTEQPMDAEDLPRDLASDGPIDDASPEEIPAPLDDMEAVETGSSAYEDRDPLTDEFAPSDFVASEPATEVEEARGPEEDTSDAVEAPINIFAPPPDPGAASEPAVDAEVEPAATTTYETEPELEPEPEVEADDVAARAADAPEAAPEAPINIFAPPPDPVRESEPLEPPRTDPEPEPAIAESAVTPAAETTQPASPINIFAPPEPVSSEADAPPEAQDEGAAAETSLRIETLIDRAEASSTAEVLLASAAWLTLMERQTAFTRREVMTIFDQIDGAHDNSLEARIKGYGRLVRNGQLILVEDGMFSMSEEERERFADLI